VGDAAWWEGLKNRHTVTSAVLSPDAVATGSGGVGGYWEMDEGIEGRSGVTLAGSNSVE
jgi:hypothetical protein